MSWIHRIRSSFQKRRLEDQLNDELQFHIEMRTREFVAAGQPPGEARRQALRLFGNPLLQNWIPASRAARVDPMTVLRDEG